MTNLTPFPTQQKIVKTFKFEIGEKVKYKFEELHILGYLITQDEIKYMLNPGYQVDQKMFVYDFELEKINESKSESECAREIKEASARSDSRPKKSRKIVRNKKDSK